MLPNLTRLDCYTVNFCYEWHSAASGRIALVYFCTWCTLIYPLLVYTISPVLVETPARRLSLKFSPAKIYASTYRETPGVWRRGNDLLRKGYMTAPVSCHAPFWLYQNASTTSCFMLSLGLSGVCRSKPRLWTHPARTSELAGSFHDEWVFRLGNELFTGYSYLWFFATYNYFQPLFLSS